MSLVIFDKLSLMSEANSRNKMKMCQILSPVKCDMLGLQNKIPANVMPVKIFEVLIKLFVELFVLSFSTTHLHKHYHCIRRSIFKI